MPTPTRPSRNLVNIQDDVRREFGWDVEDDRRSAIRLVRESGGGSKDFLTVLRHRISSAHRILILGAAISAEELQETMAEGDVILAADGAVGVISETDDPEVLWGRLAAVVSDADGHPHLTEALDRGVPFVLHAHGDNENQWQEILPVLDGGRLLLTHQCPDNIEGAFNPGGFTDGDRAICLALHLGAHAEEVLALGFDSTRIGRWAGETDPARKMRKLQWMEKVIETTGVQWGA